MTAQMKLAVFFILASLLPFFQAQSAKNDASVNLSVEIREAVAVSTKNNQLDIQTNSADAFFVLVYDERTDSTKYLSATDNLPLEMDKTYTIISAP